MESDPGPSWTFLTNYSHVLLCISRDDALRHRDIAALVGITERSAQKIIADLVGAGYVHIERVGRRNRYSIRLDQPLRHPLERGHDVGALLDLLLSERPSGSG
jgi:hypothetical protein